MANLIHDPVTVELLWQKTITNLTGDGVQVSIGKTKLLKLLLSSILNNDIPYFTKFGNTLYYDHLSEKRVEHTSLEEIRNSFRDDVSIEDLCLPTLVSYEEKDDVIEDYKEKREAIIKCVKGKNFAEEVFILLENGS